MRGYGALAVNAFDAEKWNELGALSAAVKVDNIISFHEVVAAGKNVLLVAYNCQFDIAFLDHLFRIAGRSWCESYHYFVLDIPSMAWGLGVRYLSSQKFLKQYDVEDEPHTAELHTGLTGAMKNFQIYRALLHNLEELTEKE